MPATVRITAAQRRTRLAHRHRLLPETRTDDVAVLADDLLALHSTDPVSVYLSAWARGAKPSRDTLEQALYEDRTVMRHHVMRRTLWVATPPMMRRMHLTTTARYAAAQHKRTTGMLTEGGIDDAEAWLGAAKRDVLALLRSEGPMTARAIGQRIPALAHPLRLAVGTKYEGTQNAHSRVLLQLGFEAALVRTRPTGTWINGQYTWAAMDTWLPGGLLRDGDLQRGGGAASGSVSPDVERQAARELAELWLQRFGPGTTIDLQWWAGWTVTMTKRALADISAVEVDLDGQPGWVAAADPLVAGSTGSRQHDGEQPWTAVLPGLDPTVMGWKQRDWYLPPSAVGAFDSNGNAGPTIWVDGQVVAGWLQTKDGELQAQWFSQPAAVRRRQVQARLDELHDWLGPTRFAVRFPAPYAKQQPPG
jgi:hypothetical protein